MNHQPNWKPEAPVIPAKLREDGELEEIVRQAIRTKDDVEGRRFERQRLEDMVFGVLQFVFDGGFAIGWQSIIGDYLLAFAVMGFAGLFKGKKNGIYWGSLLGTFLRFLVHYVTGATLWAEYMPDEFFGMTMTSPWIYSALYNGSFLLLSLVLTLVVVAILQKPLGKYLRAEDLQK